MPNDFLEKKEKVERIKSSLSKLKDNISQILKNNWDKMKDVKKRDDEEKIKNLLNDINQI